VPSSSKKRKKAGSKLAQIFLWPPVGFNWTIALAMFVLASTIGVYAFQTALASTPEIKLSMNGGANCLDDRSGKLGKAGSPAVVDAWPCNGSGPQQWGISGHQVKVNGQCLDVYRNGRTNGSPVDLFPCNSAVPGNQSWTYAQGPQGGTLTNNGSGLCLDAPAFHAEVQLDIYSCNGGLNQRWTKTSFNGTQGGSGGPGVDIRNIAAQFAGREKETPAGCNCGGAVIDGANINTFTQQHPGELWCADFVSWVYWKDGYGFNSRGAYSRTSYIPDIETWFKKYGLWYPNTAYNRANHPPTPGDFISFDVGNTTHGGIIDNVNGTTITDIEGNYADSVSWVYYPDWRSNGIDANGNIGRGWGRL
jgi:hypothetical protein